MYLLGPISLFLSYFSALEFHNRVVEHFLEFLLMDCVTCINSFLKQLSGSSGLGYGFWVFGSFKQAFEVLGLFLLFSFGLKVLNFSWFCKPVNVLWFDSRGKSDPWRDRICAKNDHGDECCSKTSSCDCNNVKCLNNLSPAAIDKVDKTEFVNCDADTYYKASDYSEEGNADDEGYQHYDEDKEFDVLALRKLIKMERRRANSALWELEKERMSAATAAEESMAMILRLQSEKSLIEMESKQYKRLVEEKLIYDQELIQSLKWLVMKHESDRTALEDQLELSQKKLRLVVNSHKMDHREEVEESLGASSANIDGPSESCLFRPLNLDISPEG